MTSIDYLILIVVTLTGASLLAFLLVLVVRSLANQGVLSPRFREALLMVVSPAAFAARITLFRCAQKLRAAEGQVTAGNLGPATENLQQSFYLGLVGKSLPLCAAAANHNTQVFDRLLTLARQRNIRLKNAELVEGLLESRAQMLVAHSESLLSKDKIAAKQRARASATPDWAAAEFDRKRAELEDRLLVNKRNITEQVAVMVADLRKEDASGSTLVH